MIQNDFQGALPSFCSPYDRHTPPPGLASASPMTGSWGIQYAAAFRFIIGVSGILDHPHARVMTTETVARVHIHQARLRDLAAGCARALLVFSLPS
jgi:hypothetical protein